MICEVGCSLLVAGKDELCMLANVVGGCACLRTFVIMDVARSAVLGPLAKDLEQVR